MVSYLDALIRGIHWLSKVCGFLAASLLTIACLVVCQMVIMRYFLNASTIWQTEFVTFCIVGATLIGCPYVLLNRGHVNIDLLPQKLPISARRWLGLVSSFAACVVCVILTWSGSIYFLEAWHEGWVTESVWGPPLWIPLLALPIGLGMLTLQYIADIMRLVTEIVQSGRTSNRQEQC